MILMLLGFFPAGTSQPQLRIIFVRRLSQRGRVRLLPQPKTTWYKSGCTTDLWSTERANSLSEINRYVLMWCRIHASCFTTKSLLHFCVNSHSITGQGGNFITLTYCVGLAYSWIAQHLNGILINQYAAWYSKPHPYLFSFVSDPYIQYVSHQHVSPPVISAVFNISCAVLYWGWNCCSV